MNAAVTEARHRTVKVTDEELVLLDGACSPETQSEVDAAKARLDARRHGLEPHIADLVADAVRVARAKGRLTWVYEQITYCRACRRSDGYVPYKSGPRRGTPNYSRRIHFRGIDLDRGFVVVTGHVSLGGCEDCLTAAAPTLAEELRGVPAQVPPHLRAEGEPKRVRHDNRRCTACGWEGHEGQMGRLRTLMGDGTYPALCPECNAENRFGTQPVERTDGFTVVEVAS